MAYIIINNFKCFKDERIELNALTVLVGSNGMGKSTVIQTLLLMRQFLESKSDTILLNGPYSLELGSYESVISKDAENGKIFGLLMRKTITVLPLIWKGQMKWLLIL